MASALDTARAAIEGRLATNWTTTAIAWPGHELDAGSSDWIRSTLVFAEGALESMSASGTNTIEGLLLLDLFTLDKTGHGTLYGYLDTLRDLFDRVTLGGVEFLAASGPRPITDEVWTGIQFEVPFIVEETS